MLCRGRERVEIDLELSSTFSLTILTRVSSQGLSPLLHAQTPTAVFTSSCPTANWTFLISYPTFTALWHFHLSFLQSFRARCQFATDMFLFLTRASLIILHVFFNQPLLSTASSIHVVYEFVSASPAVPRMSCPSFLDGLKDERQAILQLIFCKVLLLGLVQNSTQQLWVDPI